MKTPLSIRTAQNVRKAMQLRRNVGTRERWISLVGGTAALTAGIRQRGWSGGMLGAAGGYLLFRGMSGHCAIYRQLHISTRRAGETGLWGKNLVHVRATVTVQQSREAVYRYWRNLENLPRFMRHIKRIEVDGNRSHWVARSPLGLRLTWNAQITQDTPNERLTWRSIVGSQVDTRGEVRFRPTIDGGTEIDVDMFYQPPGGAVSGMLARMFGGISEAMVKQDITRFKEAVESQQALPTAAYDQGLGREPVTPAHG